MQDPVLVVADQHWASRAPEAGSGFEPCGGQDRDLAGVELVVGSHQAELALSDALGQYPIALLLA